ncbi:MAG: hypothetical protein KBS72_03735 [Bacteroidales bacterium]|nr:hypothetical protein [Candidatus Cacconaster scatequi]
MLDVVVNNPFRVLGIFTNAKQSEIVRNLGKIKAYLNVGKEVSFPEDLNYLLGDIHRSLDSAQKSQSSIKLPADKIRYALFWFCKNDAFDDLAISHIVNQELDNAIEILSRKISFSSIINLAVIAVIQKRYSDAIALYSQLAHNEELRISFSSVVCDDTFQISGDDLIHIVIDELLTEADPMVLINAMSDKEDIAYVSEKALSEPLARINNEISTAKSVSASDATASLRAGRALIKNTSFALNTVKSLVGETNIQYQSIADNLAKQILQCGINYFNNSDDEPSSKLSNALEIQEYATRIAVGKLVKDRCLQNLNILKKQKEQSVVDKDIRSIASILESHKLKGDSISNATALIDSVQPYLNNIKATLGEYSEGYLSISSAIANHALSMIISVINKNTDSRSNSKAAKEAIEKIQKMDLDTSTKSRVSQNLSIISSNLAAMPSGYEKADRATGGCLSQILGYVIFFGIIALLAQLCS